MLACIRQQDRLLFISYLVSLVFKFTRDYRLSCQHIQSFCRTALVYIDINVLILREWLLPLLRVHWIGTIFFHVLCYFYGLGHNRGSDSLCLIILCWNRTTIGITQAEVHTWILNVLRRQGFSWTKFLVCVVSISMYCFWGLSFRYWGWTQVDKHHDMLVCVIALKILLQLSCTSAMHGLLINSYYMFI